MKKEGVYLFINVDVYFPIFSGYAFDDSFSFSLSNNNVDALKFWIELGRLSQVPILLFQKG